MVTFRKSKKVGPLRLTLSKSGLSTSVSGGGARLSLNSKGEVRRTVGIPGTGVYDTKKIGGGNRATSGASPSGTEFSETGQTIHAQVVIAAEDRHFPDGKPDIAYIPVVEVDDVAAVARFAAIAGQDNGRVFRDIRDAVLMPDGGDYRVIVLVQRTDNPKLFGRKDDDSPKGLDVGRLGKRDYARWAPEFDGRLIQVVVLIDATPGRKQRIEVRFKPALLVDDELTESETPPEPAAQVVPAAEYRAAHAPSDDTAAAVAGPGWYPDPWQVAKLRWFDGADWTHNTNDD